MIVDKDLKKPPSIEFEDAFCDSSGIRIKCDGCGRTHFNYMEGPNFEEGELEELEKLAKESPDKYVPTDCNIGFVFF